MNLDVEMQRRLKILCGEEISDDLINTYLDIAEQKILNRLYPFGNKEDAPMPEMYRSIQLEIAAYLIYKRGAEGQVQHSEGEVTRTYENADVPNSLLTGIMPYGKVI